MEKWEQTGTLTIDVPRQQVLHVNEKGVYAMMLFDITDEVKFLVSVEV